MKMTVLIDNTTSSANLKAEWGLSLHLAAGDTTLLFDAGSSSRFADNAELLGIDLAAVDHVILSHHHFDHGNGLTRLFSGNSRAEYWCAQPPAGLCCSRDRSGEERVIDLAPEIRAQLGVFTKIYQPVEIHNNIHLIPASGWRAEHPRPKANCRQFLRRSDNTTIADDFSHELLLVIDERDGLVVVTGCAHNGVCNMIEMVEQHLPGRPIRVLAGGFHLFDGEGMESPEEIETIARFLLEREIESIWTGHCTSATALMTLHRVLGDRLSQMESGAVIST